MMHEFIAIGDVTSDDFIRLEDPRFKIHEFEGSELLSMPFREKLPFEHSTLVAGVGNAPNAAVVAARLGLRSALVASVGDDPHGEETLTSLKENGVDTKFVSTQPGKKTNYSYVLWANNDRTILRRHEDYSYALPEIGSPGWVYFSSVGKNGHNLYDELAEYLKANPDIKFAFQPGTHEIGLGKKLERLYKRADIYFSNVEEAGEVLEMNTLGIKPLLERIRELGPKIVVITDGPKGAYAYDGKSMIFHPPYPDPKPPLERTGAGDSFSATTAVALAIGKDLPTALAWGSINSMSVVQEIGAQKGLLTQEKIQDYLKNAPKEYIVKEI